MANDWGVWLEPNPVSRVAGEAHWSMELVNANEPATDRMTQQQAEFIAIAYNRGNTWRATAYPRLERTEGHRFGCACFDCAPDETGAPRISTSTYARELLKEQHEEITSLRAKVKRLTGIVEQTVTREDFGVAVEEERQIERARCVKIVRRWLRESTGSLAMNEACDAICGEIERGEP